MVFPRWAERPFGFDVSPTLFRAEGWEITEVRLILKGRRTALAVTRVGLHKETMPWGVRRPNRGAVDEATKA